MYPDKINLCENGFILAHSFRVQFIMLRKAWQQELKATGHIATTVRKQRLVNAGA